MIPRQFAVRTIVAGTLLSLGSVGAVGQSIYFKNFVRHADGSLCEHAQPVAGYIAYRNGDRDVILTERSPRRDTAAEPNIPGNGVFGVELADFTNPPIVPGDSVFVVFTCTATSQQGILRARVEQIPWYYFPTTLTLSPVSLPPPPAHVRVDKSFSGGTRVQWDPVTGLRYDVYRRSLDDTLSDGRPRFEYHRIAAGVTEGSVVDTSTCDTCRFAYMVIAIGPNGALSPPSAEASVYGQIAGLELFPRSTTVLLRWRRYVPPAGRVLGYTVYRREERGYYRPVGYVGRDTFYVDSRLQPGHSYWYYVAARGPSQVEIGRSVEVSVRTGDGGPGYYRFATIRVAVVVYLNTNRGRISEDELPWIHRMLERARLFYWRNSGMKLNLQLHYVLIREYREFGNPEDSQLGQTVSDLISLGVMNTQYDIVFRLCPAVNGYWSYGVVNLRLPGPERATGFSHSQWPVSTGVFYPATESSGLTWIFVHEVQHAIDALYEANGHPEMYHGDQPWNFPVPCGEHFDFQAAMLRTFSAYLDLRPTWGAIWEAIDADGDGFPDDEPLVPLDERRFGSSADRVDTDGDGYGDRLEALDGTFCGSNPANPDTDGDGRPDGDDAHPRYPVRCEIERFQPAIDGWVEPGWPLADSAVVFSTLPSFRARMFLACTEETLYVALDLSAYAEPVLQLDTASDGWWFSRGNLEFRLHPEHGGSFDLRAWDGSAEARDFSLSRGGAGGMWDTDPAYRSHFGRRVLDPRSVRLAVFYEPPTVQYEMAIPRTPYAGLTLEPGSSLRLSLRYERVNHQPNEWASTFDPYSFVEFRIPRAAQVPGASTDTRPQRFALLSVHPNPFRECAVIRLRTDRPGRVAAVIFDVRGRPVRHLVARAEAGEAGFVWDGCDDAGTRLPAGVYLCRINVPGVGIQSRKLLLIK